MSWDFSHKQISASEAALEVNLQYLEKSLTYDVWFSIEDTRARVFQIDYMSVTRKLDWMIKWK